MTPEVPEQNKINLIVEQNKYFNYYENKNVFKKKIIKIKTISIIVKLTLFQRNIVKMQNIFSNIYIIKIIYIYIYIYIYIIISLYRINI